MNNGYACHMQLCCHWLSLYSQYYPHIQHGPRLYSDARHVKTHSSPVTIMQVTVINIPLAITILCPRLYSDARHVNTHSSRSGDAKYALSPRSPMADLKSRENRTRTRRVRASASISRSTMRSMLIRRWGWPLGRKGVRRGERARRGVWGEDEGVGVWLVGMGWLIC